MAFVLFLGVRPLSSNDLGYHLAYGDTFLDTGRLVDTNPFLYTLPGSAGESPGQQANAAPASRPDPGPGCWYDADGRYRFPNANWLSQVIQSLVHRAAGIGGLWALQAALAGGVFLLMALAMRRMGVPWAWTAAGLTLAGLVSYQRLDLRPELFGYLVLAAEALLLLPRSRAANGKPAIPVWRLVVATLLQLLLVNLHSYFLLGLALTGAVWMESLLRMVWRRAQSRACAKTQAHNGTKPKRESSGGTEARTRAVTQASEQTPSSGRSGFVRLSILLVLQVGASFANPWGWRLAALPVQTLLFLRENQIGPPVHSLAGHPWSLIGEFLQPLAPEAFVGAKATYAYLVLLGLAAVGGLACLLRRRWAWAMVIAGMAAVSLTMRRNIAPAAFLIVPVALAALCEAAAPLWARLPLRARRIAGTSLAAAVLLVSTAFLVTVANNRFYVSELLATRFGCGISRLNVPLGPARWLTEHNPQGRLWADYNGSSNVHYFTRPHPPVPIVTNTWAYPPDVMREVLDYDANRRDFAEAVRRYGIEAVALQVDAASAPLAHALATDKAWRLVYLEPAFVIFLRADGPNEELARRSEVSKGSLDVVRFQASAAALDPVPAHALYVAGNTLYVLGWDDAAVSVLRQAVAEEPSHAEAWVRMGICLARRGQRELVAMIEHQNARRYAEARQAEARGRKDWLEARDCFRRALTARPDSAEARLAAGNIRQQLDALERGQVIQMQYPL